MHDSVVEDLVKRCLRLALDPARLTRAVANSFEQLPDRCYLAVLFFNGIGIRQSLIWRTAPSCVRKDRVGAAAEAVRDDQALFAATRSGDATVAADLCDRLAPQSERTIHRLLGAMTPIEKTWRKFPHRERKHRWTLSC